MTLRVGRASERATNYKIIVFSLPARCNGVPYLDLTHGQRFAFCSNPFDNNRSIAYGKCLRSFHLNGQTTRIVRQRKNKSPRTTEFETKNKNYYSSHYSSPSSMAYAYPQSTSTYVINIYVRNKIIIGCVLCTRASHSMGAHTYSSSSSSIVPLMTATDRSVSVSAKRRSRLRCKQPKSRNDENIFVKCDSFRHRIRFHPKYIYIYYCDLRKRNETFAFFLCVFCYFRCRILVSFSSYSVFRSSSWGLCKRFHNAKKWRRDNNHKIVSLLAVPYAQ